MLLLIDHQSGLFQTVKDMEMTVLRANATTLAKVATLAKIPVITSASVPQGPNGPLIPEIHKYAPHAKYVARSGQITLARIVQAGVVPIDTAAVCSEIQQTWSRPDSGPFANPHSGVRESSGSTERVSAIHCPGPRLPACI